MTSSSGDQKASLKLLVDTKNRKVLFAEVTKDFVDFLFHLLSLPIGTVIRLLTKSGMVGCLANLYKSVENLSETYLQPNQKKESVLNPKISSSPSQLPLLLTDIESVNPRIYTCPSYHRKASLENKAVCPDCNSHMTLELKYVAPVLRKDASSGGDSGGFVKGLVTYMVMDDLVVEPMSTISGITLFNKFHVKEVGSLEEKVVQMTMNEGLKLLQASLQCKTVLTSVFLGTL